MATIGEERACHRRRFLRCMAWVGTGAMWSLAASVLNGRSVTNRDDIPHNVVSTDRAFKSPVLDTGETFSHTFDVAGMFKYYCSLHPG